MSNNYNKPKQVIRYGVDERTFSSSPFIIPSQVIEELVFGRCNAVIPSTTFPVIKKVIFNKPATIVFWEDGTKTVVKALNEDFDPEKGLAMAIAKKALGNKGNYFSTIKKWTKEYSGN